MVGIIQPGEKYSLIAVPCAFVHDSTPAVFKLSTGLWATRSLPTELGEDWRKWIGTLLAQRVEKATLFLVATGSTKSPDVLDEDNQILQRRVWNLYWGLLIACTLRVEDDPVQLTGGYPTTGIDVRSLSEIESPKVLLGSPIDWIGPKVLQEAAALELAIAALPGKGQMDRFGRVLHAFYSGITDGYADYRLHQFVRCVEGFILPEAGKTKSQFKSRTELFIGPKHHTLAGEWFDIRSTVEHLHGPLQVIPGVTPRDQVLTLFRRAYEVEVLAKYCVKRLLLSATLRAHFQDDTSLAAFWNLPASVRSGLWGSPLDIDAASRSFNPSVLDDETLGL